jgi:hypothetical protein
MTDTLEVDIDYLRQRLRYEPETGKLYWLASENMPKSWQARWVGREAFTSVEGRGSYKRGSIDCVLFKAHRVAWALHYGEWPTEEVDHINGVRDDNRIVNLRVVSSQGNRRNTKRRSDNTSGVCGVYRKGKSKWRALIVVDGKQKYLGCFGTPEEAAKARKEAEVKYEFHENHGRD